MQLLMYVLLNFLNGAIKQDTDTSLAMGLLNHLHELPNTTLEQMALKLAVSDSTLHRFIARLGFDNYTSMREIASQVTRQEYLPSDFDGIQASLKAVERIECSYLDRIVHAINEASRVYIVGYGTFYYAALYFQNMMFCHGRYIQVRHLVSLKSLSKEQLTSHDLVIVVSKDGHFLSGGHPSFDAKQILITQKVKDASFDMILSIDPLQEWYGLMRLFERLLDRYHILYQPTFIK